MIIPMEKRHAEEIGGLHHKYIISILRDLGKQTCIDFYDIVLESENNFGFVYVENSRVMAFIFGTVENSQLFKHPRILYKIAISLLKKPWVIIKMVSRLIKRLPSGPEVSFIAVEKGLRRKGLANQMVIPMFEEYKRRNYTNIMNWIEERNKASLSLSLNAGSKIIGEFWEEGRRKFILDSPVDPVLKVLTQGKN